MLPDHTLRARVSLVGALPKSEFGTLIVQKILANYAQLNILTWTPCEPRIKPSVTVRI